MEAQNEKNRTRSVIATSHVQARDRKLRFTRPNTKHLECYRRLGVFCKMHRDRTRFVVHVHTCICGGHVIPLSYDYREFVDDFEKLRDIETETSVEILN